MAHDSAEGIVRWVPKESHAFQRRFDERGHSIHRREVVRRQTSCAHEFVVDGADKESRAVALAALLLPQLKVEALFAVGQKRVHEAERALGALAHRHPRPPVHVLRGDFFGAVPVGELRFRQKLGHVQVKPHDELFGPAVVQHFRSFNDERSVPSRHLKRVWDGQLGEHHSFKVPRPRELSGRTGVAGDSVRVSVPSLRLRSFG
mmetsp:Transcript_42993/g.86920  ORF Transcript_42993/g.86920 Transcript_42993/m.86920 type:complete len:204 (+) Transcript_42993:587-1198(+)